MNQPPNPNAPKPWFRAKRYGYGAGLPIAWQGWALLGCFLIAFLALLRLFVRLMDRGSLLAILPIVAIAILLGMFIRISRQRSDKDWDWRWGEDED